MSPTGEGQSNCKDNRNKSNEEQNKTGAFCFEKDTRSSDGKYKKNFRQNAFNKPKSLKQRRFNLMENDKKSKIKNGTHRCQKNNERNKTMQFVQFRFFQFFNVHFIRSHGNQGKIGKKINQ